MKSKLAYFLFLVVVLSLSGLSFLPIVRTQEVNNNGDITFQPNSLPFTTVAFSDSRFVFDWEGNHFEVAMFIQGEDFEYEFEVEEGKTKLKVKVGDFGFEEEVESEVVIEKSDYNVTWGLNIWDIPLQISNYTENLVFKIVNANFNVSEIEEIVYPQIEGYNTTHFILPDNLLLSYEDLFQHNLTVTHTNKYEAKVEGVKGKSKWNLDPITYSDPLMTGTGGTEGSEFGWWDLWNASNVNGWNVAFWHPYGDVGFYFNCSIRIGGSGSTTWFADTDKAVQIGNSTVGRYLAIGQGHNEDTHFRLGTDGTPPRNGGYLRIYHQSGDIHWSSELEFYGATIKKTGGRWIYLGFYIGSTITIKYSYLEVGTTLMYRTQSWERVNAMSTLAFFSSTLSLTADDIRIEGNGGQALELYTSASFTVNNAYFRDNLDLAFVNDNFAGNLYLVNSDVDVWSFRWDTPAPTCEVYRQYEFDLTIYFMNGSQAQNANVTITNDYLATSDSWLTFANGSISPQTYSYGHYNQTGGDTIYNYNPYNLTVTLDGYETYTDLINITQQEGLRIALTETTVSVTYTSAIIIMSLFLLIPVGAIIWRLKR